MTGTPRYNFGYDSDSRYATDPYAENKDFDPYALMQAPKEFNVAGRGKKDTSSIDSSTMDTFQSLTDVNNQTEAAMLGVGMSGIQTQNQIEQAQLNAKSGVSSSGGNSFNQILDAAGMLGGLFKGGGSSSSSSNSSSAIRMAGDRISNLNIFR